MALPNALDASTANGFTVTIDGIQVPQVIEVSGLKMEVDKVELKQQTSDGKYVVRQVMARQKAGTFQVTRGVTDSKTVSDWLKQVAQGDLAGARKTASVALLDYTGSPIKTYEFENCWVSAIEVPSLKAGATELATEKFTICYDGVTVS